MFAAPGRLGGPSRPVRLEPRPPPRRSLRAPVSEPDPAHRLAPHPQRAAPARSASRRGTSGSSRCGFRELDGDDARRSRRPTTSAPGSRTASAGCCSACAEAVLGPGARVELVAPGERAAGADAAPRAAAARWPPPARQLNPRLTFDQFVIGDGNRLAHAAALAVAEMPGPGLQPALHLRPARPRQDPPAALDRQLRARARRRHDRPLHDRRGLHRPLRRRAPGRRRWRRSRPPTAASTSCSSTTSSSSQSKAKTEQEFFHTFNALHEAGAQLVLTSDRLPRDMDALEDRLRERFEAGLVTDVRPPDRATRLTVLRKRVAAGRRRRASTDAALELIADRVDDEHPRARGRADPRRRLRLAHRPRRSPPSSPTRSSPASTPTSSRARPHTVREIQEQTCEALRRLDRRPALLQPRRAGRLAAPGRHVPRARADRRRRCRRSAARSAAATTPPSCTPAGAPRSASPTDPEAYEAVRTPHRAARRRRDAVRRA